MFGGQRSNRTPTTGKGKNGKRNESMSYVLKILRPGEQIIVTGKLHWIIYLPAIVLVLLSFVVFGLGFHEDPKTETFAFVFAFVAAAIGRGPWNYGLV